MSTTILSTKGQVIIPKEIRSAKNWEPGQELVAVDTPDGVLLRPQNPFKETKLEDVAGCLQYSGKALSLEDMENAIKQGVMEQLK